MSFTLLAIYACGDDGATGDVPDERADAGLVDGAKTAPEGSSSLDQFVPTQELPGASIALGDGFGCIVAADHTVYCWGRNDFGQLGSDPAKTPSCGSYPCTPTPVKVEGLKDVVSITAGKDFACALDGARHGWCWGNNSRQQIAGRKGETSRFTPEIVTDGTARIVASGQHACILDTDGFLHCWGDNDCKLFGDDKSDAGTLGVVELVTPQAKWMSLGPDSMCTVTAETSEIYCWGADHKGSLGHPLPSNAGKCANSVAPAFNFPPHWAPLGLIFYNKVGFPPVFQGDALVAFHGTATDQVQQLSGYNVSWVRFRHGQPTAMYDLVRGWNANGQVWGRPAGLLQLADGSVLISDDLGGRIFRLRYTG